MLIIMLKWLWLSVLVIVLDQLTKWGISSWLSLHESIPVLPFFNLTLAHNTGAAFSFLAQSSGWQRWFFIGLAATISVALLVWLARLKPQAKLEAAALTLILGGALGNVIDRVHLGYVIDFIDFYVSNYHWPAFNVADSSICLGAILLLLDTIRSKSEQ